MKLKPTRLQRRQIDLRSAAEVIDEINRLRLSGYEKTGQWNLTQICQHLTASMNGGMEGFGFRVPWIVRATVAKWAFRYCLNKRKLFSGAPTFKILKPQHASVEEDDAAIEECIETCRRTEQFAGPIEDYALLNDVSVEDWRDFMWIHAAHHLGFLVPKEAEAG